MKKLLTLLIITISFPAFILSQIVTLVPAGAGASEEATLIFDATQGNAELVGFDKVYVHHGVVTSGPTGTDWSYVIGNWGEDDGVGEMTLVAGETDKWEIHFTPTIREYFGVPSGENIFRISAVFRSADGSVKGTIDPGEYGWGTVTANGDFYVNLNTSAYISLNNPSGNESYINPGESISIEASASAEVSSMKIWIDEGSGYEEKASVSSGTTISYEYFPSSTIIIDIKVTATINAEDLETEKSHNVVVLQSTVVEELPAGIITGINYDEDNTTATLALEAPGKDFAFVVGDFTNWNVLDDFQMKVTPDAEIFWLEITGLVQQQEYVFQYWVDGTIKIGDPYADKVADPWNDHWIEEEIYPNLPDYTRTENHTATVLQTGQVPYEWSASEDTWEKPDVNNLIIYELHIRDFTGTHSYSDLIDSLNYIKNLGVDAIELMPVNEFEGNSSWGYNPSYYFAPDKYYGPKDELKRLIETAHEIGLAVINDMVLNHAFGQNAMVKLFFNQSAGTPSSDNPWFNENYVGPYQWGYDFNHESDYTKAFIDRVNAYWLEEYHFDGFRFDFTKGFTNYSPGGSIDGFDQSRINILKRMADEIWEVDPEAYIILEHWGPSNEETILGDYGMKMWRNKSYDYVPVTVGNNTGSFSSMNAASHVAFFDSHDERRIAEHALTEGYSNGIYNIKNPVIMYERVKMAAAFAFLFPGPKMIWQFDELGYDIDINFNGRTGPKPLPWGPDGLGYYEDELRQYILECYKGILDVRNQIGPANLASANTNHNLSGYTRGLSYDMAANDLVVIGNFGLSESTIDPRFTQTGAWYNYFTGEEINVTNTSGEITLDAGEWHIYTTVRLSDGLPGVVEVFKNSVTIEPLPFKMTDEITITLDATKLNPDGTAGLIDAEKVYLHSGLVLDHPDSTNLSHIVGTLTDDGLGEMTGLGDNIWEITFIPQDYYDVTAVEVFKIGMYFRDADNTNVGMGFRDQMIFVDVLSGAPFVTIEPAAFNINEEITITFNALQGNRELMGTDKVYIHSGAITTNTTTPHVTGWENVVGNWGEDDGIGEMTEAEDDQWQITLTPESYYGLQDGDVAYWISCVFRSADGSVKGTGTPGELENGYIHENLDFFIRNAVTSVSSLDFNKNVAIYPNPSTSVFNIAVQDFNSQKVAVEIINLYGQIVRSIYTTNNTASTFEIVWDGTNNAGSKVKSGIYFCRVSNSNNSIVRRLIKL